MGNSMRGVVYLITDEYEKLVNFIKDTKTDEENNLSNNPIEGCYDIRLPLTMKSFGEYNAVKLMIDGKSVPPYQKLIEISERYDLMVMSFVSNESGFGGDDEVFMYKDNIYQIIDVPPYFIWVKDEVTEKQKDTMYELYCIHRPVNPNDDNSILSAITKFLSGNYITSSDSKLISENTVMNGNETLLFEGDLRYEANEFYKSLETIVLETPEVEIELKTKDKSFNLIKLLPLEDLKELLDMIDEQIKEKESQNV